MCLQPLERAAQLGSEFNSISLLLQGRLSHVGDIYVEGGGLRMGTGSFTVANLDFSRARRVSFLGSNAVLGAGKDRRIDVKGKLQCIDQQGSIFMTMEPHNGSIQTRGLSARNTSRLGSNVGACQRDVQLASRLTWYRRVCRLLSAEANETRSQAG